MMKRLFALLLCVMLAVAPTLAEENGFEESPAPTLPPEENPFPDAPRGDAAVDSFPLAVNGETISLGFDASTQYSSIQDGLVQASYYAYAADGVTMYELYLIFPDTARPGMVYTPEYAALANEECSVVLIVSDESREVYYSASLMDGAVYPTGSTFAIGIDGAEAQDGGTRYSGTLSATLVALDLVSGEPRDMMEIPQTAFAFTVGGGGSRELPGMVPQSTPLAEDMRKV